MYLITGATGDRCERCSPTIHIVCPVTPKPNPQLAQILGHLYWLLQLFPVVAVHQRVCEETFCFSKGWGSTCQGSLVDLHNKSFQSRYLRFLSPKIMKNINILETTIQNVVIFVKIKHKLTWILLADEATMKAINKTTANNILYPILIAALNVMNVWL